MRQRSRSVRNLFGGLLALALVAAGCSSSGPTTAQAPTATVRATPTSGIPDAQPISVGGAQVIPGTATGSSPCERAAPTPASPGEVGVGGGGAANASVLAGEHGPRGLVTQLPIPESQRFELQKQMEEARAAAARYPTVASAEAAGYHESTVYVPCIGAHFTNIAYAIGFDPKRPSELLYDGTSPDSHIVGLSYLVYHHNGAPPGFAGPNDHWHQHNANGGLCLKGGQVIAGEESSRKECAALGGHKTLLIDVWMLHAWVVPGFECSWGVFSGECPELGGRIGGTAWEAPAPS